MSDCKGSPPTFETESEIVVILFGLREIHRIDQEIELQLEIIHFTWHC